MKKVLRESIVFWAFLGASLFPFFPLATLFCSFYLSYLGYKLKKKLAERHERLVTLDEKLERAQWTAFISLRVQKKIDARLTQLQKQFVEKTEVLEKTRKDLFSSESQLLLMKLKIKELEFQENPLEKELAQYEEELTVAESEIELLKSLIPRKAHAQKHP